MSMSLAEAHEQHAKSDSNRAMVIVREHMGGFSAEWEGETFNAISPWVLDTIMDGRVPTPRNLYLVDDEATEC